MNTRNGINLLSLVGRDTVVKHVANTRGGEYAGACPKCRGQDRFRVQPETGMWCCRQCHPKWDGAIGYVMWIENIGFKAALALLNIPLDSLPARTGIRVALANPDAPKPLGSEYMALNDPDWQEAARAFCYNTFEALYSADGRSAREYLKNRGISPSVMESAGLGYNPQDIHMQWGLTEVWFPRGIIIPWMANGKMWRVNCRPPFPVNGKKYIQAAGGANGLYNADAVRSYQTVVMVEGEFDSLVIRSQTRNVIPVATGTVSWARVIRWVSLLSIADEIALAFDTDTAGAGAVDWWQKQLGDKARRLAPTDHDVTDMWIAGQSIIEWLAPVTYSHSFEITLDTEARREQVREELYAQRYVKRNLSETRIAA